MSYLELYEQWRHDTLREGKLEGMREGKLEGIREGKREGIQETILTIYRTRFASVPDEIERRVRKETDGDTLMAWCNLFTLSSADEIARKLTL